MQVETKFRAIVLCLGVVGVAAQFNGNYEEYSYQIPVSNYWYRYWTEGDAPQRGSTQRISVPYQSKRRYEWRSGSNEDSGEHWQSRNHQEKRDLFQLPDVLRGNSAGDIKNFFANLLNANKNGAQRDDVPKNGDDQQNTFNQIIRKGGDYLKNFLKERNLYPSDGNNNDNHSNGDYMHSYNNDRHQNGGPNFDQNDYYNNNGNDHSSVDYSYNDLPENKTSRPPSFHFWIGAPMPTSTTKTPDQNPNWSRPGARPTINQQHTADDDGGNLPSVGTGADDTVVPIERDAGQIDLVIEAQQQCGRGTANGEYTETSIRIARGHVASETYPWLIAINQVAPGKGMQFICGGSLISTKHAVSAAHCFLSRESDQYEFIISNNRILKPSEAEATLRKADRIILHPGYNPQVAPANADVAVIIFQHPVQFGDLIKPICLWRGDSGIRGVVGEIGRVVGWGADENLNIPDTLPNEINMRVIDYRTCILRDHTFINIVGENSFCTGYRNGSGPCMGDSGSGFMLKQNGRWSLRGVVSLTTKLVACDINHYIGITDVAKYTSWIESVLRR